MAIHPMYRIALHRDLGGKAETFMKIRFHAICEQITVVHPVSASVSRNVKPSRGGHNYEATVHCAKWRAARNLQLVSWKA